MLKVIIFLLLFFSESFAFEENERKIILKSGKENFTVDAKKLSILIDKTGKLNIEEVEKINIKGKFKLSSKKVLIIFILYLFL